MAHWHINYTSVGFAYCLELASPILTNSVEHVWHIKIETFQQSFEYHL